VFLKLVKCFYCDEDIGYLPFKCKYCGNRYCKNHRLPENHDCTFELKYTTVPSKESKKALSKPEAAPKRLYREGEYLSEKEIKRLFKQKKDDYKERIRRASRTSWTVENVYGTTFLMVALFALSIAALIFPEYLMLSGYGVLNFYFHTFFTALFVVYAGGFLGILFLFIIIFFLYNMARSIELRYGTKFLLGLFAFSGLFSGLFFLLFRFLLVPFYPIPENIVVVGLGWSAILGVISFLIFPNMNTQWNMYILFMPIRMSGKILLIFLVLIRLIPGLIEAIYIGPIALVVYCFELAGILAAYLVYHYKSRVR